MRAVLFSPHFDDEVLFAAYSIIRYRPEVVVCFPSRGDYGATDVRMRESTAAGQILGATRVKFVDGRGGRIVDQMRGYVASRRPDLIFAPAAKTTNVDHLAVSAAASRMFGARARYYHTYAGGEKVREGVPVDREPAWVLRKLKALSCFETQTTHPRACKFFEQGLDEYLAE